MIFPLHYCHALGCQTLIDPDLHFCADHLSKISKPTAELILNAADPVKAERARDIAMLELAVVEGRIDDFYELAPLPPPAASREETTMLPCAAETVPGDAVMKAQS